MNPYEVLGVSEDADEETIKKAYRTLVKKYHPDKYVNNPLADLADEKIKEINKAYDMLINRKSTSGSGYNANTSYSGATGDEAFRKVRELMTQNKLQEALTLLNSLPRTAEWYYLAGRMRMQVGWYDQAVTFMRTAVNMEPTNEEYRSALENVLNRTRNYSTTGGGRAMGTCKPCDCCTTCMCLNCMCC